MNLQIENEKTI